MGFGPWGRCVLDVADLASPPQQSGRRPRRDRYSTWLAVLDPTRLLRSRGSPAGVGPAAVLGCRGGPGTKQSAIIFWLSGRSSRARVTSQVLDAFERLWKDGSDVRLTVAGRRGWTLVHEVVEWMAGGTQDERRFEWLENATDAELDELYAQCTAVVMASEGEGFGLPIVEAATRGCPVVVRDIAACARSRVTAPYTFEPTPPTSSTCSATLRGGRWRGRCQPRLLTCGGRCPTSRQGRPTSWNCRSGVARWSPRHDGRSGRSESASRLGGPHARPADRDESNRKKDMACRGR